MRRGGERARVRRRLRHSADAGPRSPRAESRPADPAGDVQKATAQLNTPDAGRAGFHVAEQQTTGKRKRELVALAKALQVDGGYAERDRV